MLVCGAGRGGEVWYDRTPKVMWQLFSSFLIIINHIICRKIVKNLFSPKQHFQGSPPPPPPLKRRMEFFHTTPLAHEDNRWRTRKEEFKGTGKVLANLWGKLVLEGHAVCANYSTERRPRSANISRIQENRSVCRRRLAIETLVHKQGYTSIPNDLYLPSLNKNQVQ